MASDEMTWDDGLSLDALAQYLRGRPDAADAMPLLLYCIDCSRFLRHVASAAQAGAAGSSSTRRNTDREPKTAAQLKDARDGLVQRYLREDSPESLCRTIRIVLPCNVVYKTGLNEVNVSDKMEVLSPRNEWRFCTVVDHDAERIHVRYEKVTSEILLDTQPQPVTCPPVLSDIPSS